MDNSFIISSREVIGDYLANLRKEKGVSKYVITKKTGLPLSLINSIEKGSSAYTIDSLLKYTTGIGAYMFFGDKVKKNPDSPLDEDDMLRECDKNNPYKSM